MPSKVYGPVVFLMLIFKLILDKREEEGIS